MNPLATILYEDAQLGREYPLHTLVMRMVEDEIIGSISPAWTASSKNLRDSSRERR